MGIAVTCQWNGNVLKSFIHVTYRCVSVKSSVRKEKGDCSVSSGVIKRWRFGFRSPESVTSRNQGMWLNNQLSWSRKLHVAALIVMLSHIHILRHSVMFWGSLFPLLVPGSYSDGRLSETYRWQITDFSLRIGKVKENLTTQLNKRDSFQHLNVGILYTEL